MLLICSALFVITDLKAKTNNQNPRKRKDNFDPLRSVLTDLKDSARVQTLLAIPKIPP